MSPHFSPPRFPASNAFSRSTSASAACFSLQRRLFLLQRRLFLLQRRLFLPQRRLFLLPFLLQFLFQRALLA